MLVDFANRLGLSRAMKPKEELWPSGAMVAALAFIGLALAASAAAAGGRDCDRQAEQMLGQMTLEEKLGQMTQADMNAIRDKDDIRKYCLGSMLSGGDSDPPDITARGWQTACREYQNWALKTRLRIPLIYGIDAVHGHNNVNGAVIFPHNIGLGASRNTRLVQRAEQVTAREVAGTGIHWAFAPCVAVAQDLRWGRTYESFSDSPWLAARLAAAAVRGLQQPLPDGTRVLACAKHFLGDGGTQNGVDQGDTVCDEAALRQLYLPPYRSAVKAGVGSIMVSYNSWNGQKMHGNKYLLTGVLKGELGFKGFLVSDWAAIDQLSPDYQTDIERAVNAGLDMMMIPNGPGQRNSYVDFIRLLKELVAEGKVPQARIDDAVHRILRTKYELGLFDHPFAAPQLVREVGSARHREVARECVRQSLVLLKNEGQALPLSRKIRRLAVVGKAADDLGIQCGGWTISWQGAAGQKLLGGTTLLEALRQDAPRKTQITFSPDAAGLAGADAILVVIGELPYAEMKGDRPGGLSLSQEDADLVAKAKATGAPVVTLLYSGRPLVLGATLDASDAFVAAWLPGTEGEGIADVLLGRAKPHGKLPRPWPRGNDQLSSAALRGGPEKPLFPFGYGLTY